MGDAYRIDLEPITSSNLAAIGYDPQKNILAIEFKGGDVFHYAGISLEMALDFYSAPSRGSFYAKNIRGKFEGALMTGRCPACGSIGRVGERCDDCGTMDIAPRPPKGQSSHESAATASTGSGGATAGGLLSADRRTDGDTAHSGGALVD